MSDRSAELFRVRVPGDGVVSALWLRPVDARALLLFGHGAGAGMRHVFMEAAATALADHGVATLRYQFPYMESGGGPPDRAQRLVATVRAACETAGDLAAEHGLTLLAGGKSMGGRMTSTAAAEAPSLPGVRGLVFFGFPLHAAGRPGTKRADHLENVGLPMLFLQGTRDRLADLDLLRPILASIDPAPTLHVVSDADHGFHVLKRTRRTDEDVIDELAGQVSTWADGLTADP